MESLRRNQHCTLHLKAVNRKILVTLEHRTQSQLIAVSEVAHAQFSSDRPILYMMELKKMNIFCRKTATPGH